MSTLMLQTADGESLPCEIETAFDPMDDDALFEFCARNKGLSIERTAKGEIVIMSPTGWEGGFNETAIGFQLFAWAEKDGRGFAAGSTPGFLLADGSMRAPDASWILRERLAGVPRNQRKKFLPRAPDFVIEVRSESDSLGLLKRKMEEYRNNGVALGWLIDPLERRVHVYGPDGALEVLDSPATVIGSGPVDGFVLEMRRVWNPPFGD